MKLFRILICLLFPLHCWAQATIEEIRKEHPRHKGSYYSFPKVILKSKPVSDKINADLVRNFLDVEIDKVRNSIFEDVWGGPNEMSRLSDVEYKIVYNSSALLSLAISAEGCGAYCESFTNYYTYALKTGSRLGLIDILNTQGQKFVLDSLRNGKKKEILDQIAIVKDSLKSEAVLTNAGDKEYYEGELELYRYCLESMGDLKPSLEYIMFFITSKELHVITGRCSNHADRNVDELDDFEFVFALDKMNALFTMEFNAILQN